MCFSVAGGLTSSRGWGKVVTTPLRGSPRSLWSISRESAGRRHGGKKRNSQSGFFEED